MSAVEYDVLVKLRVDRATQKGLGESVKPLDKGLTKIEKDRARAQKQEAARQKAAGREFLRQQLATERSIAKATAQRMRTAAAAQQHRDATAMHDARARSCSGAMRSSTTTLPCSVGVTPRVERSISVVDNSSSSSLSVLVSAGCDTCSRRAALPKCSASAVARK